MSFERQSFDAPRAFPLHQRGHQPGQLALAAFGCTQPCTLGFSTSWRLFPSLPPVTPPPPPPRPRSCVEGMRQNAAADMTFTLKPQKILEGMKDCVRNGKKGRERLQEPNTRN